MKKENKRLILGIFLSIFIIIPVISSIECSAFQTCPESVFQPYSDTQLRKFDCQNNQCVPIIKEVECTTTAKCLELKGTEYLCDTKNFKCVKGATVEIVDEEFKEDIKEDINTNNNPITSAIIIALGIIVGLVILGLLIRKRNK